MRKKIYMIVLFTAMVALNAMATTLKFPSDGTFTNATEYGGYTYYKTWVSNDGVVTIEGKSKYAFYDTGSWLNFQQTQFTVTISGGNKLDRLYISSANGYNGDVSMTDEAGTVHSVASGGFEDIDIANINKTQYTFTIDNSDGYFYVYPDRFYIYYSALEVEGSETVTYKLDDGSFSSTGAYCDTWQSADGAVTLKASSKVIYYAGSGSWAYFYPATYTVTNNMGGNITRLYFYYPKGGSAATTFEESTTGKSATMEANAYPTGNAIDVTGINSASTTFTISGSHMYVYYPYLYIYATRPVIQPAISASGYTVFCYDKPLDISGLEEEVYVVTGVTGSSVELQQITGEIPANTGVIIKGTPGKVLSVPAKDSAGSLGYSNLLVGVNADTAMTSESGSNYNFILVNGKFVRCSGGTLAAHKAYLPVPKSIIDAATAKELSMKFTNDNTTRIRTVDAAQSAPVYYNLQGVRVQHPQKGIYIVNGKKVVVQ